MLTLQSILDAKERRWQRRLQFHRQYPQSTIISLTLAIPGPIKDSPLLRQLFQYALTQIQQVFPDYTASCQYYEPEGPQGLLALPQDPASVKKTTCRIEISHSYARLWDIDVYGQDGQPRSDAGRQQGRPCLLCSRPVVECMREHRHKAVDIQKKLDALLIDFRLDQCRHLSSLSERIGQCAARAALYEAVCYPSPGLVDAVHQGSHNDMDIYTFINSSTALTRWFGRFFEAGLHHAHTPATLLALLRRLGQQAERDMYAATKQVNTHKGLLFSLGILLGALGLLKQQGIPWTTTAISQMIRTMTAGITEELTQSQPPYTAGERFYHLYGITGIRGEVEQGFPTVFQYALPALKQDIAQGQPINSALLHTLFILISYTDDTTILSRKPDIAVLRRIQAQARQCVTEDIFTKPDWSQTLWKLDAEWVSQHLSPGGSADLLTITWFLYTVIET
jgi:holo-ACP synthase/triphosphoribosyl-dephospho-CoA synthase